MDSKNYVVLSHSISNICTFFENYILDPDHIADSASILCEIPVNVNVNKGKWLASTYWRKKIVLNSRKTSCFSPVYFEIHEPGGAEPIFWGFTK